MQARQVRFNPGMSAFEKKVAISSIRDSFAREDGAMENYKVSILAAVANFAEHADLRIHYKVCNSICLNMDLPGVEFVQHVINQINKLKDKSSDLHKIVLPLAEEFKNNLSVPLNSDIRTLSIFFGVYSIYAQSQIGIAFSVTMFAISDYIVDWRINNSLNNKLAIKNVGGESPGVDDNYDGAIKGANGWISKGYGATTSLFKSAINIASNIEESSRNTNDGFIKRFMGGQ